MKIQKRICKKVVKFLEKRGTLVKTSNEQKDVVLINFKCERTVTLKIKEKYVIIRLVAKKVDSYELTLSAKNKHVAWMLGKVSDRIVEGSLNRRSKCTSH